LASRGGAVALPVLVILALWLATGVSAASAALFCVYALGFVAAPGWVVYRALVPVPGTRVRQFALGSAVGLALAVIVAPAGVWAGGWLALYPLAALPLLPVARRRRSSPGPREAVSEWWLFGAAVCVAAALIAAWLFAATPLPGKARVAYGWDMTWHLSMAGEALHHWPITDPQVSGVGMPYHIFSYLQIATAAHVTGIGLPVLLFRLMPLLLVALLCLLILEAARSFTRGRYAAALTIGFLFLAGELDLAPSTRFPFLGSFVYDSAFSPNVQLGLVFTLAAVVVFGELLAASRTGQGSRRTWLLFAFLVAAAIGTKVVAAEVLVVGLFVFAVWSRSRVALLGAAVATASSLVLYVAFFRGGSGGTRFDPPGALKDMVAVTHGLHPTGLVWALALVVGLAGRFGGLAPAAAVFRTRTGAPTEMHRLLASLFLASLVPFLLLRVDGLGEEDYVDQASFAGALLAAEGVVLLWSSCVSRLPGARRWLPVGAVVWLGALCVVALQNSTGFSKPYTLLARLFGIRAIEWSYVVYPLLALALLALAVLVARRRYPLLVGPLVFALVGAVVLVAALDQPLDLLPGDVHLIRADRPLYDQAGHTLTPQLYRGLVWVRDHSRPDDVIAVDNHDVQPHDGAFFAYGAFAERRVFLGGWTYSVKSFQLGETAVETGKIVPFPERLRLNDAVFRRASRSALDVLVRDYGVRFLLVDRVNGTATPRVARLGRRVYANDALTVYSVAASPAP
jgi:hypothetical protein